MKIQICANVGLLHHILGFMLAAHDGSGDPKEEPIVAPHDDLIQARIARSNALYDFFVGEFLGFRSRRQHKRSDCKYSTGVSV